MSIFHELKRRNVFRVAAAYLVAGWLLIEVSETLEGTLHLPEWADTLLAYFIILGFPIVLFFSWAYEITPEGIKREKDIASGASSRTETARRLDWAVIILFTLAGTLFVADRYWLDEPQPAAEAPVLVEQETFAADGAQQDEAPAAGIPALSIAVLPFVNMSPEPEQEYFSDGLTEELLNLLAGVEQLKVAARTLDDIFAIQDEIAAAVTEELKITLLGEAPKATVIKTESYEMTLHGRYLFSRRQEGDMDQALELFEKAVEIDSDNAAAWVGLAPLYLWLFDPPRVEDALAATERAVTLDPDNPEAWSRRSLALWHAGREDAAESAFARATALGKNNPLIQSQIAGYRGFEGDLDGAIEAQQRAVALDPLYAVNVGNLASYLILAGRLDEARIHAEKVLTLAPSSPQGLTLMADIHLLEGRPEEARAVIERVVDGNPQLSEGWRTADWYAVLIEHSAGNDESSRAALERFAADHAAEIPLAVACLHAWRGNKDKAFEWLDRALEQYPNMSVQYSWEPWLDSLEDDPRWGELMKRWTGTEFVENF